MSYDDKYYKEKYLKYKSKYLNLKKQLGGSVITTGVGVGKIVAALPLSIIGTVDFLGKKVKRNIDCHTATKTEKESKKMK